MSIVFLFSAVNQPIPRLSSPKASQDILSSKSHHSSEWVRHLKNTYSREALKIIILVLGHCCVNSNVATLLFIVILKRE